MDSTLLIPLCGFPVVTEGANLIWSLAENKFQPAQYLGGAPNQFCLGQRPLSLRQRTTAPKRNWKNEMPQTTHEQGNQYFW